MNSSFPLNGGWQSVGQFPLTGLYTSITTIPFTKFIDTLLGSF